MSRNNLLHPITINFDESVIHLELDDGSRLYLHHHQRPMELNVLNRYGLDTDRPIYFFSELEAITKNVGKGTYLMNCASLILDQNEIWVLNEVRPRPFSIASLNRLVEFYKRFGYTLLEKGIDSALMARIPCEDIHKDNLLRVTKTS